MKHDFGIGDCVRLKVQQCNSPPPQGGGEFLFL